jgi:hypothetical protein
MNGGDEDRTNDDVSFAREGGAYFGTYLTRPPMLDEIRVAYSRSYPFRQISINRFNFRYWALHRRVRERFVVAGKFLQILLYEIARDRQFDPGIAFEFFRTKYKPYDLILHIDSVMRLLFLSDVQKFEFIPVVYYSENVFGTQPIFDLFNRRGWRILWGDAPELQPELQELPKPNAYDYMRQWGRIIEDRGDQVQMVDRRQGAQNFVTLLIDSLRASVQFFKNTNSTHVDFTVHSHQPDYQLNYWPQFNVSPQSFGGGIPTTPVSDNVRIGHYCFEGERQGKATQDSGVYFAAPGHTVAHLRNF